MQLGSILSSLKHRVWFVVSQFNCLGTVLAIVVYCYLRPDLHTSNSCSETFPDGKTDLEVLSERFPYGLDEAYDAKMNLESNKLVQEKGDTSAPFRYRFAADELDIGEKLFVGILTTIDTIDSMAVALNRTIGHSLDKTLYFYNGTSSGSFNYMHAVVFQNKNGSTIPQLFVNFINDNVVQQYDWFYFSTDKTYVRADKLVDLVHNLTFTFDIFLGSVRYDGFCDVEGQMR